MKAISRIVDHLVYCVPNLEKGIDELSEKLGVRAVIGGKHIYQGTKNALIKIGAKCYLEILAVDEENLTITGERWMGIDLISEAKLTRWSTNILNLNEDRKIVADYNSKLAQFKEGSRLTPDGQQLQWVMSTPLAEPEVEPVPFLLDWSKSAVHPTDALEDSCQLLDLIIGLPAQASSVKDCLLKLAAPIKLIESAEPKISAIISSPKGIVEI